MDHSTDEGFNQFLSHGGFNTYPDAVLIRIDVRNLVDIDMVRGSYNIDFILRLCFSTPLEEESELDEKSFYDVAPDLKFRNMPNGYQVYADYTKEKMAKDYLNKFDPERKRAYYVYEQYFTDCTLNDNFELEQFPYDYQRCSIYINIMRDTNPWFLIPVTGVLNM